MKIINLSLTISVLHIFVELFTILSNCFHWQVILQFMHSLINVLRSLFILLRIHIYTIIAIYSRIMSFLVIEDLYLHCSITCSNDSSSYWAYTILVRKSLTETIVNGGNNTLTLEDTILDLTLTKSTRVHPRALIT